MTTADRTRQVLHAEPEDGATSEATIMTVNGPIEPAELGVTLHHEHLLVDGNCYFELADASDAEDFAAMPLSDELVPRVRLQSCSNRDNLRLDDLDLIAGELADYQALGGTAVVDVTSSVGLGRRPAGLRELASRTGLHIVMGCGFYCEYSHPDTVAPATVDELAEFIRREVVEGADGIRAGVIGEIGINGQERGTLRYLGEMTPDEEKTLRAACRASLATGAAVCVHQPNRPGAVHEIMRVVAEEGLSPDRVILGHMSSIHDFQAHLAALERGFWIAYDNFGMAGLSNAWYRPLTDDQRVEWLVEVVEQGFIDRVLISHDVWCKVQLRRFGGGGYAHILRTIVPRLLDRGLSESDVRQLLVVNPARVLAF